MVFSSLEFIYIFLPAFLLIYAATPQKSRNFIIFAGSTIFYAIGVADTWQTRVIYIALFLLTMLLNFIVGQFIQFNRKYAKFWLIFGMIFNFWWLIFFKYWSFGTENINAVFGTNFTVKNIILPIGISFYTFQNASYIADVYRRTTAAESSFINYGAYISMFPQLIAGPIVTYKTVAEQLRSRRHTFDGFVEGLKIFTIGLGSKVIIANQIGGLWNDIAMIGFESISTPLAWMGLIAYSFQIYFDFLGYSLMAIGLGKLMGFELPKNFDYPYLSVTMTEFWRRWHITLGTWFRENIYIPLGGSREGTLKTIRNTLIVWLLTGLWHGASWNFVLWGMVLFLIITSERFITGKFFNKYRWAGHIYMIILIPLTWLLFAVTDFSQLGVYLTRLFPFFGTDGVVMKGDFIKYLGIYWKYFLAGFLFSLRLPKIIYEKLRSTAIGGIIADIGIIAIFWAAVYCMYLGFDDPFMYLRF